MTFSHAHSSKVLMSTSGPIKAIVHTLACQRGHNTKQRRQDIFIKDRKATPFNFTIVAANNPYLESGCRSLSFN